jgi:hypothetical protein
MPLTTLYAFQFNGLTFGGAGSPYQIQSVDGLEGLPQIRNQDDNRGYADGMFTGQDFLSGRTLTIIFNTFATSGGASAQANYNSIQQKLLPQVSGTTPLYFFINAGGTEQYISARVRALRTTIDPNFTYGYITTQVEFFCPDPNYYDSTLQTASLVLGSGLGRIYNRTFNYTYGTGVAPFTTVTNAGWATTYPTITFNGPITNPIIGNATTGNYIYLLGNFADTDVIVVNTQDKLITLNGQPARNLMLGGSTWFALPTGTSNIFWLGSGTLAGTTAGTITWRNAYI